MMRVAILVSLILLISSAHPAMAEIFKYRDAQGTVRYTYDLGEVPEDQRPGVQTYQEASSAEAPPAADAEIVAPADTAEKEAAEDALPPVDDAKIEELDRRKKDLEREFAALMEAKYQLLKQKEKLDSMARRDEKAISEYDDSAKDLNRKIADYQKRQEAFQKEVEAVNKAVEKSEAPES